MKLTDLLTEKGDFVSGQEIAETMGISRSAVWKQIERLRREGVVVEAVTGKGYRIVSSDDAFGEVAIRSKLHTKWLGKELLFYKETGSTNDELRSRASRGAAEGMVAVADVQKSGKGRRGRVWTTPPGVNIAMSYLLRPAMSPDKAPVLTLVMALASHEGIRRVTGLDTGIKWPNDIVSGGRKIVGILTEMTAEPDYIHEVIIGTGINVNEKSFPEELEKTATSLYMEGGREYSRSALVAAITEEFEKYYEDFMKAGSFGILMEEYNRCCVNTDNRVKVLDPKGEYEGTALGVNEEGDLLVKRDMGGVERVYAGEVSVRGVYGYT